MQLHQLQKPEGSTKKRKRVGRGPGSGLGKTCGKGQKGQKSRSGGKIRRGFEGGQMPLSRRLPKFGFKNISRQEYAIVNVSTLEMCDALGAETVTKTQLKEQGLIRNFNLPVKLLGDGEIKKSITVEVDSASRSAIEKIEEAGGKVIQLSKEG